jgi:hypothetical protein
MSSSAFPILKSGFRKREARSSRWRLAVGRARVAVDLGSSICALRRQAAVAAVAVASRSRAAAPPSDKQLAVHGLFCSVDILSMFFGTECPLGARLKPAFLWRYRLCAHAVARLEVCVQTQPMRMQKPRCLPSAAFVLVAMSMRGGLLRRLPARSAAASCAVARVHRLESLHRGDHARAVVCGRRRAGGRIGSLTLTGCRRADRISPPS